MPEPIQKEVRQLRCAAVAAYRLCLLIELMNRSTRFLCSVVLAGSVTLLSGCASTLYFPKLAFERIEYGLKPPDPVLVGPGGAGPLWSTPQVSVPSGCNPCCPPGKPLQPIDPFGWIKFGSMGTQQIDPLGWVFGI